MRAYMYTTLLHSAQLMIDSRSHDTAIVLAQDRVKRKAFPRSSVCSIVSCCLVHSGLHERYTDAFNGSEQSPSRQEQSVKLPVTLVVSW